MCSTPACVAILALKVALAPCVVGYAEIAARLTAEPDAHAETNPYRVWIAEYAGEPYQEVAAKARAHLDVSPITVPRALAKPN